MRSLARLRAVGLVAMVVVAGCAVGPTATPSPSDDTTTTTATTARPTASTPTPTPATEGPVTVRGDLEPDADRVFRRVQRLHDRDVAPPSVFVVSRSEFLSRVGGGRSPFGPFMNALGFAAPPPEASLLGDSLGGVTYASGNVVLYAAKNATPAMVECVLAHEYVHVVQVRTGAFEAVRAAHANRPYGDTLDAALARRATTEGAAVYVEHRYSKQYGGCGGIGLRAYRQRATSGSPATRILGGPYYEGWQYVSARVDDPANLSSVYGNPPLTTEQVLHNYTPAEEPPAPLSVRFDAGGTDWDPVYRRTLGELVVRETLATNLSRSRAARAAAGWGNDTVLQLSMDGTDPSAFVWVTRWDDAGEADEFEAALGDYLDARFERDGAVWTDRYGRHWAVRRVGPETVALVVGWPSFVNDVTLAGTAPVVVSVDGRAAASRLRSAVAGGVPAPGRRRLPGRTDRYDPLAALATVDARTGRPAERRSRVERRR